MVGCNDLDITVCKTDPERFYILLSAQGRRHDIFQPFDIFRIIGTAVLISVFFFRKRQILRTGFYKQPINVLPSLYNADKRLSVERCTMYSGASFTISEK